MKNIFGHLQVFIFAAVLFTLFTHSDALGEPPLKIGSTEHHRRVQRKLEKNAEDLFFGVSAETQRRYRQGRFERYFDVHRIPPPKAPFKRPPYTHYYKSEREYQEARAYRERMERERKMEKEEYIKLGIKPKRNRIEEERFQSLHSKFSRTNSAWDNWLLEMSK